MDLLSMSEKVPTSCATAVKVCNDTTEVIGPTMAGVGVVVAIGVIIAAVLFVLALTIRSLRQK